MIGAPPLEGAVQLTVALPSPLVALRPVGAPGTVALLDWLAPANTTVDISHTVLAPVLTEALGVAPAVGSAWSSESSSMSPVGETLVRCVNPCRP